MQGCCTFLHGLLLLRLCRIRSLCSMKGGTQCRAILERTAGQLVCVGKGSEEAGSIRVTRLRSPHSLAQCSGKGSGSWGARHALGTGEGNTGCRPGMGPCLLSTASWRTPKPLGKALCRQDCSGDRPQGNSRARPPGAQLRA